MGKIYIIKKPPKQKAGSLSILFVLIIVTVLVSICLYKIDQRSRPLVVEISQKYATAEINKQINIATEDVIKEMNLTGDSLFNNTMNQKEQLNYMNVNTILVNEICSRVNSQLSENLENLETQKIKLPIGIFSGINFLANTGPKLSIKVMPLGDAFVDYETNFESVGINQVNFHLWLNVECEVGIINPLYSKNVKVKRKLMLVNTIFNGEVPSAYLDVK